MKKIKWILTIVGIIIFIVIIYGFLVMLEQIGAVELSEIDGEGRTVSRNNDNGGTSADLTDVSDKGKKILESAEKIAKHMKDKGFTYSLTGPFNNTYKGGGSTLSCCATYVSWVLQDIGAFGSHTDYSGDVDKMLSNNPSFTSFVAKDDSELLPGDINIFGTEHVNIYAGNSTCWDAGQDGVGAFVGSTVGESVVGDGRYTKTYRAK